MIKAGDKIPSATLRQVTENGAQEVTTDEFFRGKRVALFAVPGAFTSVCSAKHLPRPMRCARKAWTSSPARR